MMGALINHLWQSTLFAGAIGLITLTLREHGAALRHTLWLIASLKFLVPFSVLYWLGAQAGLPVLPAPWSVEPQLWLRALDATTPWVAPTTAMPAGLPADATPWLPELLVLLWGMGSLTLATRWYLGWRAADSVVRAARPAPGAPRDVLLTHADIEPAVARVLRPVVLLPSALLGRLSPRQLAAVLAHERTHAARRDNLCDHLQRLVQTLFWFHPLVWWIGRRMAVEREAACDEAVLDQGHAAQDYAEGILAVCRHCRASAAPMHVATALSGNLRARVQALLEPRTPRPLGFWKALLLSLLTAGLALGLLLAGAADAAERQLARIEQDARNLWPATIEYAQARPHGDSQYRLETSGNVVWIRNVTLRELVALAYGVDRVHVSVHDSVDDTRYDIAVHAPAAVSDAAGFDPRALRGVVNRLIGAHFGFEIYVNQHCEQPCGRNGLTTAS